MTGTETALDFTGVLDTLGFTPDQFVSVLYWDGKDDVPRSWVGSPTDAPAYAASLPETANVFFGVSPVRGPARHGKGRGLEADVTCLTALVGDFDFKDTGCGSRDVALAIIAEIGIILGTKPTVVVESGHGLHAYWPIEDGQVTNGDITRAKAMVRRFRRLVLHVAGNHQAKADSVFALNQAMRLPGSNNNKGLNGEGPSRVTAHLEPGGPLNMAEVEERLDEVGILERDNHGAAGTSTGIAGDPVLASVNWDWADHTCNYATKVINGWVTDRPKNSGDRNPFVYDRIIRLFCMVRNGCLTEADYTRARDILINLLTILVTTTEPRRALKRFEINDLDKYGIAKVECKTDDEVLAELGKHDHSEKATDQPPPPPPGKGPSWGRANLGDILSGQRVKIEPTLMSRSDGVCLLYPGLTHDFHGESDSGKSMILQAECARLINEGKDVLYLDHESDVTSVVDRMLVLGADPAQVALHLDYRHPEMSPRKDQAENDAWDEMLSHRYALVVIDGVTDAMGIFGYSIKDNDEAAEWNRLVPRQIASETGAAVAMVDHVAKNATTRGRFAIGSQAKMAGLTGASFSVETTEAFGVGMVGEVTLRLGKDRPGSLKNHCGPMRKADRSQEAARIAIDATGPITVVTVKPPKSAAEGAADPNAPFRPTTLMERLSRHIEEHPCECTRNQAVNDTTGNRKGKLAGLTLLIDEGFVQTVPISGIQRCQSVRAYRSVDDPLSEDYFDSHGLFVRFGQHKTGGQTGPQGGGG